MLKALIKKQFQELFRAYFNTAKGERRSNNSIIGFFVMFIALIGFLGFTIYTTAEQLAVSFCAANLDWLYFAIMGLLAVLLGTLGSVFNTFTSLYKAKDNEFLLTMPIPPSKILFVRMISVYLLSLIYESIVFVPTLIAYFVHGSPTIGAVITSIISWFTLAFFIAALTCVLGWLVALISSKLKNKSFVTVFISIALFAAYYYFFLEGMNSIMDSVANIENIANSMKAWGYPFYAFGLGASGNILYFLIVNAVIAALFALCYFILSKTFIKIVTKTETTEKKKYSSNQVKSSTARKTLFKKEWKGFSTNASYMLNCGISTIIMVLFGVLLLINGNGFINTLNSLEIQAGINTKNIIYILPFVVGSVISAMMYISAPSISLEGKSCYILQTLPIDPKEVLKAKLNFHCAVCLPFVVFMVICAAIGLQIPIFIAILVAVALILFIVFVGLLGLIMGVIKPNLTWVNEAFVIKQGMPVMITMFGGMLLGIVLGGVACALALIAEAYWCLLLVIAILAVMVFFMQRWLLDSGAQKFSKLS